MKNKLLSRICRMKAVIAGSILTVLWSGSVWAHYSDDLFARLSLKLDGTGMPYVAYSDIPNTFALSVMKFQGGSWVSMEPPRISAFIFPSLMLNAAGEPYVAYSDKNHANALSVVKFVGDSWVPVGLLGYSAMYPSLALSATGVPYIAYIDRTYEKTGKIKLWVLKFKRGAWLSVGAFGFFMDRQSEWVFPSLALNAAGVPFVGYMEVVNGNSHIFTVNKFEGGSWVSVGSLEFSPDVFMAPSSIMLDTNGIPYIAYTDTTNDNKLSVVKFVDGKRVFVGTPGFTSGGAISPSLALSTAGVPYVAYAEVANNSLKLSVMKFEGGAWASVGAPNTSPKKSPSFPSLALSSAGVPYVAYTEVANNDSTYTYAVSKLEKGIWVSVAPTGLSSEKTISSSKSAKPFHLPQKIKKIFPWHKIFARCRSRSNRIPLRHENTVSRRQSRETRLRNTTLG